MPRSFLVKKYLKQKYDADQSLQKSLREAQEAENGLSNSSNDNNNGSIPSNNDSGFPKKEAVDSDRAWTPYTPVSIPSMAQPLAVRLTNGYIHDITSPSLVRSCGVAEASHTTASTPKTESESAARENFQPRRSVIVTNSNHPANRNSSSGSSALVQPGVDHMSRSVHAHMAARYVPPGMISGHGNESPPPAHVQSPPPAHAPVSVPLLTHGQSLVATSAHVPIPPPAHTPGPSPTHLHYSVAVPAQSPPSPAHAHYTRPSPRAEFLPADHPIHHPLIQHLINQRLHVPEESSISTSTAIPISSSSNNNSSSSSSSSSIKTERDEQRTPPSHYSLATTECSSNSSYSNNAHLMSTSSNHSSQDSHIDPRLPPSPSPSLPSSSPSRPSMGPASPLGALPSYSTPPLSHSASPPPIRSQSSPSPTLPSSSSPGLPSPSKQAQGEPTSYTYEAFLVSDGRSRKRRAEEDASANGEAGRMRYTCSECGKDYATSSNLSRHKQTHRSLDSQSAKKCPHCDKVYVSMPALSMHILTHDLRHSCNVCGKTFSRPWLLQGHMRSHTGEKPFGCAHCGKAFADRSNLRAHMQTHSAFKHFACKRCNKTFALKSYLNKHLESSCMKE